MPACAARLARRGHLALHERDLPAPLVRYTLNLDLLAPHCEADRGAGGGLHAPLLPRCRAARGSSVSRPPSMLPRQRAQRARRRGPPGTGAKHVPPSQTQLLRLRPTTQGRAGRTRHPHHIDVNCSASPLAQRRGATRRAIHGVQALVGPPDARCRRSLLPTSVIRQDWCRERLQRSGDCGSGARRDRFSEVRDAGGRRGTVEKMECLRTISRKRHVFTGPARPVDTARPCAGFF